MAHRTRSSQSGNVFVIILISILLFGALSVFVADSSQDSGGKVDREHAKVAATIVLRQAGQIKTALENMRSINGCTEQQLSYEPPGGSGNYTNSNAPTDFSCHFFYPEGGGLTFEKLRPPREALSSKARSNPYWGLSGTYGVNKIGTEAGDLIVATADLNEMTCRELNRLNGVAGIPQRTGNPSPGRFTGAFGAAPAVNLSNAAHRIACIEVAQMGGTAFSSNNPATASYVFYMVLIAR